MSSKIKKIFGGAIAVARAVSCREGDWCEIVCDCGQVMPVTIKSFEQLLLQYAIPVGTSIENLRVHGCPMCEKDPGLYIVS